VQYPLRPFAPVLSRSASPGNFPMLEFGAEYTKIMHVEGSFSSFSVVFADF
jgi:hypothetical protein